MNNEKTLLLQLSHHILYSYFERNDFEPLLSALAEDVVWIGTGKHMCLTGYAAVFNAFAAGKEQLVPCVIQNERHLIRHLGADYWLCQYIYAGFGSPVFRRTSSLHLYFPPQPGIPQSHGMGTGLSLHVFII